MGEDRCILDKLMQVQAELKAPKSQRNTFGNYNYRNCEDILEAVKPLLVKVGLVLTITDEIVQVGDRYYVKARANIVDSGSTTSGEYIFCIAYAREEETKKGMDASQITGAASSYARKYCLNGLFLIDDTKDADSHDNREHKPEPAPQKAKKLIDDVPYFNDEPVPEDPRMTALRDGEQQEEVVVCTPAQASLIQKKLKMKKVTDANVFIDKWGFSPSLTPKHMVNDVLAWIDLMPTK